MSEQPFQRLVPFAAIGSSGLARQETASPAELAAIAEALGLLELKSLMADVEVSRNGEIVEVSGRLRADSVQACVVTLVPVSQRIDEAFSRRLVRAAAPAPRPSPEVVVSPEDSEDDPPDLVTGDRLDIGEILVEELALLIDPYPRAPGAEFASPRDEDDTTEDSPFAILKTLGRGESS